MRSTVDNRGTRRGGGRSEKLGPSLPVIAVIVAALALLVALTFLLTSRLPGERSAEAGFARDMMVHHAQAVEMAEILRDKTQDERMRTMAADISLTQQNQIGQMQGWLAVWDLPITGSEPQMAWMGHSPEGRMPGMASSEEISRLREATPREAERLFLRYMIPHHKAALDMSRAVLDETDRPEVRRLATAIRDSQKGEIRTMQRMLEQRGAAPTAGEEPADNHSGHGG